MNILFDDLTTGLDRNDVLFLQRPLLKAIKEELPVPASVSFFVPSRDKKVDKQSIALPENLTELLERIDEVASPQVIKGVLVLPLSSWDEHTIYVVVYDVDPHIFAKMASEWLGDLQNKVQHKVDLIRRVYVDPYTGVYNSRGLQEYAESSHMTATGPTLFFVSIGKRFSSSTTAIKALWQHLQLLRVIVPYQLFSLQNGMVAFFRYEGSQEDHNIFSHRLLRRLRRESFDRSHVAYLETVKASDSEILFDTLWHALTVAEKRGPFSLCNAEELIEHDTHPFTRPPLSVLAALQKKWRGKKEFSLILLQQNSDEKKRVPIADQVAVFEDEKTNLVVAGNDACYFLLTGYSNNETEKFVSRLQKHFSWAGEQPSVLIGYVTWPFVSLSKTAMVDCCLKAVLHASLLENDNKARFDHLSYNVSGDVYFDAGDYRTAASEYKRGLKLQPEDVNLLNSLGVTLVELGRYREAFAMFQEVLSGESGNQMALTNAGYTAQELGFPQKAMSYLEQGVARSYATGGKPTAELVMRLGRIYNSLGLYAKTIEILEKAKELLNGEGDFARLRLLGEAYMQEGKADEAIQVLQKALRFHPHDGESLAMLGYLYATQGEGLKLGLDLCSRSVRDNEENVFCWNQLARLMYALKRFDEAEKACRKGLAQCKDYPSLLLLQAAIEKNKGRIQQTKSRYRRILKCKKCTDAQLAEAKRHLRKLQDGS